MYFFGTFIGENKLTYLNLLINIITNMDDIRQEIRSHEPDFEVK